VKTQIARSIKQSMFKRILKIGAVLSLLMLSNTAFAGTITTDTAHNVQVQSVGFNSGNFGYNAVSFVADETGTVSSVDIYVTPVGGGVNMNLAFFTDSGGLPTTQVGIDSNVANPTGSCGLNTYTFGTPVSLTGGVTYWLVFEPASRSGTIYNNICSSGNGGLVTPISPNGSSWTANQEKVIYSTFNITGSSPATSTSSGYGRPPFPSSFGTTTYQVIDNPNQDYMNGMILFFGGMIFMIWLFKKQ